MGHAVGQQFGHTLGVEHDVVVDHENMGGPGRQGMAYADVVAAGVAEIAARLEQGDVGVGLTNRGLGAILRSVVDDDKIERGRLLLQARQAGERVSLAVPVENDDGHVGVHGLRTGRRAAVRFVPGW